jgi:NAD+ synthase
MDLIKEISTWLREKVKESKAKGLLLGLSGGIDSAVVAALAKRACPEGVLGVIMPCESKPEDGEAARLIAGKLNLKTEFVDLSAIYKKFMEILPEGDRTTRGNLKARLRMVTLYYFANKYNYLVTGTGNKSEIMVGYFTKYGDGGVDLLPLGGLLKSEVRVLAEELGIPPEICNKVPSAGLYGGQTDEGELGITYQELDEALLSLEKKRDYKGSPEILKKVKKVIRKSKHKRAPIPIF